MTDQHATGATMKRIQCLRAALLLALLPGSVVASRTGADDEALLRRVADGVVKQTTRRLIDRGTGQTFEESSSLAPKPEISIESKFNAWFYQTWLLTDGMRRTAAALNEPRYRNYGEQNLAFIYRYLPFFTRQRDAKMTAAPVGDGTLSPIGFYFSIGSLWHTGLAPLVLEQYAATKDEKYRPYLERMRRFLATNPRFEDGALHRKGKGMMTDDPYMTVPFLVREWKLTGDGKFLDDAIAQVAGTHRRLFVAEKGLYLHLWDLKTQQPAGQLWGRGNGWMALAEVELLAAVPQDHPKRTQVLAIYRQHCEGMKRFADPEGGWHQVLDEPSSWIETSCSGMFTYALARGVNEGWLDASFAPVARGGWKALGKKITDDGDITDVCASTDTGDLKFYLNRPRLKGDLHGFGSFLLAGAEIVRMRDQQKD